MAKMRPQYRTTQITTACQVMPDQIAPRQERCTRMKAIDDGYTMSSRVSSFTSGMDLSGWIFGSFMGTGASFEGPTGRRLYQPRVRLCVPLALSHASASACSLRCSGLSPGNSALRCTDRDLLPLV